MMPDGAARISSYSNAAAGFEPTSVELYQTGTLRTLYRLSYSAAALAWLDLNNDD